MKFESVIKRDACKAFEAVTISHGDETLEFNTWTFRETRLQSRDTFFSNTNLFLNSFDDAWLDKLFYMYTELHKVIDTTDEIDVACLRLSELLEDFVRLTNPEKTMDWFKQNGQFKMANDLSNDYQPKDTPVLTYLTREYAELLTLAEYTRLLLPVWGKFITQYSKIIGTDWKEYYAMGLVLDTELMVTPQCKRLLEYLEATINNPTAQMPAVINGLGTTELPAYVTAHTIIRKLAMAETNTPGINVIRNISNHARDKAIESGRTFNGRQRHTSKRPTGGSSGVDDDNTSNVEDYRLKESVAQSDISDAEYTIRSMKRTAIEINCLTFLRTQNIDMVIERKQLACFTVADKIDPHLFPMLSLDSQLRAAARTMAYFAVNGWFELCTFLSTTLDKPKTIQLGATTGINIALRKGEKARLNLIYHNDDPEDTAVMAMRNNQGYNELSSILEFFNERAIVVNLPKVILELPGCNLQQGSSLSSNRPLGEDLTNALLSISEESISKSNTTSNV